MKNLIWLTSLLIGGLASQSALCQTTNVKLPGTVSDIVAGGAGKYLLVRLEETRRIVVLDVPAQKLIGEIPLSTGEVGFAAGKSKVVLVDWTSGIASRWDIATQKKELTKSVNVAGNGGTILMGAGSEGPAVLSKATRPLTYSRGGHWVLNLKDLQLTPLKMSPKNFITSGVNRNARISLNGKTISIWNSGTSPSGLITLYQGDDGWRTHKLHRSVRKVFVSADGNRLLTGRQGAYTKELESIAPRYTPSGTMEWITGVDGPFYMGFPNDGSKKAFLYVYAKEDAVGVVEDLPFAFRSPIKLPFDKRHWFFPKQGAYVSVGSDGNELQCSTIDVDRVLGKSGKDFLVVSSMPIEEAKADGKYEYQIEAKPKGKNISYALEVAPDGMSIDKQGKISWNVGKTASAVNQVVVKIRDDSNNQLYHKFAIEVADATGIAATSASKPKNSDVETPKVNPAVIAEDSVEFELPSRFGRACLAGGGRYLCMQFNELRKIGIFDLSLLKMTGYIPAIKNSVFAAGKHKLVVFDNDNKKISRWNLADRKLEWVIPNPLQRTMKSAVMGNDSDGPILVGYSQSASANYMDMFDFLDLNSLSSIELDTPTGRMSIGRARKNLAILASATGTHFCVPESGLISLKGRQVRRTPPQFGVTTTYAPSASGKYFLSNGVFDFNGKRLNGKFSQMMKGIPSADGGFFLAFVRKDTSPSARNRDMIFNLYHYGENRPLASGPPIQMPKGNLVTDTIFFVARAKVVVQASDLRDKLTIHQFDPDRILTETETDYLVIDSTPPSSVDVGSKFSYQLSTKSKSPVKKYSLDSAPNGMVVDAKGMITWSPTAESPERNRVLASVIDELDQVRFQTFDLQVNGGKDGFQKSSVAKSEPLTKTSLSVEPASFDGETSEVIFDSPIGKVIVGGGGRYLCAHLPEQNRIAVIDACLAKVSGYIPALGDTVEFAASKDKLVLVNSNEGLISRWGLSTQKMELAKPNPFGEMVDKVVMGSAGDGPVMLRVVTQSGFSGRCLYPLLSLNDLEVANFEWDTRLPNSSWRAQDRMKVSADGKTIFVDGTGAVQINNKTVQVNRSRSRYRGLQPTSQGEFFMGQSVLDSDFNKLKDTKSRLQAIPGVTGNFFLTFQSAKDIGFGPAYLPQLYLVGTNTPLCSLPIVNFSYSSGFGVESSVFFIPEARVYASVSSSREEITFKKFDLEEEIEKTDIDYLLVTSVPNSRLKTGELFEYQLEVLSKNGGLKYSLDSAPEGMKIGTNGKVEWQTPDEISEVEHEVIVTVKDGKQQEAYHKFKLHFPDLKDKQVLLAKEKAKTEYAQSMSRVIEASRKSYEERKALAKSPAGQSAALGIFKTRIWTDQTGEHKLEAKFVEIRNRSTVLLMDAKNKIREVPINSLSSGDAFVAVESDLERIEFIERAKSNPRARKKLDPAIANQIYRSIDKLLKAAEESDGKELFGRVYHPEFLRRNQVQIPRLISDFKEPDLVLSLLRLNVDYGVVAGDRVVIRPFTFKLHRGDWLIHE